MNNYFQGKYPILKKESIAKNCYSFIIHCPNIVSKASAGQFVHILVDGFSLRRPISICEIDSEHETLRIVFEIRGEGTKKLADLNEGMLIDMIGPLGKGFTVKPRDTKAVLIGGGIGVPPMLELAHCYNNATAIIGFRSSNAVILDEDFEKSCETIICTDDGTLGRKGFVTDALKEVIDNNDVEIIYACGPHAMLKAIIEIANNCDIACEVSLEERMGCGVGACLVCACKTVKNGEEYMAHVCKDGPVFKAEEVIL